MIYFATCGVVRREMRKKTFPSNFRFSPRRKNFLHHWQIWILNGSLLSKKWLGFFFFFPISMDMLSWDLINESESKTNFIFLRSYRFFLLTHNDVDDKKWETLSISLPYFSYICWCWRWKLLWHIFQELEKSRSRTTKKKEVKIEGCVGGKVNRKVTEFFSSLSFSFPFRLSTFDLCSFIRRNVSHFLTTFR